MGMKKVGLVTVSNHNYGSLLQSFALQEQVTILGYDVQIIRYREGWVEKLKRLRNKEYFFTRGKTLFDMVSLRLFRDNEHRINMERRHSAFDDFIKGALSFSCCCNSHKDLSVLAESYDMVLLGSDQVWHPMNLLMDFFTLNFVPDNIKRVAYAPSFGVSTLPNRIKEAYKNYISRFQYLSSREETGVQLIKDLTGRDVEMVCDPTLLLDKDKWINLSGAKKRINEKYVFCYFIGNNPRQRVTVVDFAKHKKLKIVALLHIDEYIASDEQYADITPYDIGPLEFLNLIKNAEYVMTDSFHATVFSLLFHIPFYTFNRFENNRGNSTISRIDNLLALTHTQTRKVSSGLSELQLSQLPEVNFIEVDEIIGDFRNKSLEYLSNALKS